MNGLLSSSVCLCHIYTITSISQQTQLSLERVAKAVEKGFIGKKEDNAVHSLTPNSSK